MINEKTQQTIDALRNAQANPTELQQIVAWLYVEAMNSRETDTHNRECWETIEKFVNDLSDRVQALRPAELKSGSVNIHIAAAALPMARTVEHDAEGRIVRIVDQSIAEPAT